MRALARVIPDVRRPVAHLRLDLWTTLGRPITWTSDRSPRCGPAGANRPDPDLLLCPVPVPVAARPRSGTGSTRGGAGGDGVVE